MVMDFKSAIQYSKKLDSNLLKFAEEANQYESEMQKFIHWEMKQKEYDNTVKLTQERIQAVTLLKKIYENYENDDLTKMKYGFEVELEELEFLDGDLLDCVQILKKKYEKRKEELQKENDQSFEEMMKVENNELTIDSDILSLYPKFLEMGRLQNVLSRLSLKICKHYVTHLLTTNKAAEFRFGKHEFKFENPPQSISHVKFRLDSVCDLVERIVKELIPTEIEVEFGDIFYKSLVQVTIDKFLKQVLSENLDEQVLHALQKDILNFEQKIRQILKTQSQELLLPYVNHLELHIIKQKCDKILDKVRNDLLKDESRVPYSDSVKPLFHFPLCKVHNSVVSLINQAVQLMESKTKTSEGQKLQDQYVVAIIRLYRLLIPFVKHRHLNNVKEPEHALQFYCDCMYISHQIYIIHSQNSSLNELIHEKLVYNEIGEKQFSLLIQKLRKDLLDILKQNPHGFIYIDENYSDIESIHQQVLNKLLTLSTIFTENLPGHLKFSCICELIDTFLNQIIDDLIDFGDIPEETCEKIATVFQLIIQFLQDHFNDKLLIKVGNFARFQSCRTMLTLKLTNIPSKFESGELKLHADEVMYFIKVLFADTPNRSRILQVIHDLAQEQSEKE